MAIKNLCGKGRDQMHPYAIYKGFSVHFGDVEYRVLKTYQAPHKEQENQYARWLVAVKSDCTFGGFEIGDTYIAEIFRTPDLECTYQSDEFRANYTQLKGE
jgi:hypothetical protein